MPQQKISPARIYLLLVIIVGIGAVLGILSAIGKMGKINLPVTPTPAIDSKIKSAVVGEDFLITLDANPSTGYSWTADFDNNYLALRSKDFVPDRVSPGTVGAGGKEVFTFAPLKAGETTIRAGYSRPWESKAVEIKDFKYVIKEKTSNSLLCSQRAKVSDTCSKIGFEFNPRERKCVVVNGAGCIDNLPFGSLEECQKTCEKAENKLNFETFLEGRYSEIPERKNSVITSQDDWLLISNKVGLERSAPLPPIDFSKEMLVAVFQGEKPAGGYGIEIAKIIESENKIKVFAAETEPGPECIMPAVITRPYHIVKIKKSSKEVMFNIEKVINDCK